MAPNSDLSLADVMRHPAAVAIVFAALLIWRLQHSYYSYTFFQPDEYFQALEPAWQIAFGPQSGAWITWEWRERLRTAAHPYIFAGAYKAMNALCNLLDLSRPDRANALIRAPGILQAFFAALMDFATWRTAGNIYGIADPVTWATLSLTVISPWQRFCSIRTFSNSLEATLTAIAISLFPWEWYLRGTTVASSSRSITPNGLYPALTAAAIAFYLRPTNIIIWMAISAGLIICNRDLSKAATLLQSAALAGTAVIVAFAGVDRTYYSEWAFPPLRFLYMNIVQSLAVFYGMNRVDYYFTEGLPILLTTALPFAASGVWQSIRRRQEGNLQQRTEAKTQYVFAFAIISTILAMSMIGHKEMRFIYPLLPMLLILAAKPYAKFFDPFFWPRSNIRKILLYGMVVINLYIAAYVSMRHQRGVVAVTHYLRHRQEAWFDIASRDPTLDDGRSNITVGFLMPCHSTPWRSHLVYPEIQAWALTCEPPINMSPADRATYLDEADVFYLDPAAWLQQNMEDIATPSLDSTGSVKRAWPYYWAFFEHLEPTMKALPESEAYKECRRFFNTDWIDDSRRKGDVIVWCRRR